MGRSRANVPGCAGSPPPPIAGVVGRLACLKNKTPAMSLDSSIDGSLVVSIAQGTDRVRRDSRSLGCSSPPSLTPPSAARDTHTRTQPPQAVTKLRNLLLTPSLSADDRALALNLLVIQLRGAVHGASEAARGAALGSSLVDITLSLIVGDESALVRSRAAALIGEILRGGGGGEPVAIDGDSLAVIARAAARDEDASVRASASAALADALTGDESSPMWFSLSPGGVTHLAEAVALDGGHGHASRVASLMLTRGGERAVAAALEEPALMASLSDVLAARADELGLAAAYNDIGAEGGAWREGAAGAGSSLNALVDPSLDALSAVRALVFPDAGKAMALAAGIAGPLCAHLIHPSAVIRCAAAGALAAFALHIPAAHACLGDGAALPAALLPQLSVGGATGAAVRGAVRAVCALPAGRAAFFSSAVSNAEWMASLISVLPVRDSARDLVAMARSPHAGGAEQTAARRALLGLESLSGGLDALDDVPGSDGVRALARAAFSAIVEP